MKIDDSIISDALAEALGQIVTEVRREWLCELEVLRAERRALIADLRLIAAGMSPSAPEPAPSPPAKPAMPVKASKSRTRP